MKTPQTPAPITPPPAATDDGEVTLRLDIRAMPESIRKDLEANAHIARTTPAARLAKLITRRLAPYGITLSA